MANVKADNRHAVVKLQQYTLRIPQQLYKQVKLKLIKEDKKLSPLLIEMLQGYLKK